MYYGQQVFEWRHIPGIQPRASYQNKNKPSHGPGYEEDSKLDPLIINMLGEILSIRDMYVEKKVMPSLVVFLSIIRNNFFF